MTDYEKAILHIELALRRTSDDLRKGGETNIENAFWSLAEHISILAYEARRAAQSPQDTRPASNSEAK